MKKYLIAFLVLCGIAQASVTTSRYAVRVTAGASGDAIPASFTAGDAESEVCTPAVSGKTITIQNGTTSVLAWGKNTSGSAPSIIGGYIAASTSQDLTNLVEFNGSESLFIATPDGATTSGTVLIQCGVVR